jgi:hypothetical protein
LPKIKEKKLMSNKLLGFSKIQVDAYIGMLKKEQEEQMQDLKNQIAAVAEENEKLNEEVRLLRSEKVAYESKAGLIRLSFERLEKAAAVLNRDAQQESAEILDSYEQRLDMYDAEIIQIKNEIKDIMKSIDFIVQGIMELLKNGMNEIDTKIGKSTETATECGVCSNDVKEQKESSSVQSNMIAETPEIQYGGKSETEVENKVDMEPAGMSGNFWGVDDLKMTSDGTTISNKSGDLVRPALLRDGFSKSGISVSAKGKTYTVPLHSEENTSENTLGSSWEEALQDDKAQEQNNYESMVEVDASKSEAAAAAEGKDEEQAGIEATVPAESSPTVAREISRIRQKYILGKIAGEDLLDSKGNIIIAKNEVITDEIVEKAEREGNLSELILNMALPDLNSQER